MEETAFKESVKRQISPMIMCLQVDRTIFRDMIGYYPQLPNQAKEFVKSQMDRILRIVLSCKGENERPDEKQTQEEMHFLYKKLKEEHTDLANTADFIEIIQLFKDFVRNQGQEPKNNLSKVLHQLILLNKDVEFMVQSCKELLDLHLIGLLCDLNSEDLVSQADLLAISEKTSKPVFDLLMETIFYPEQEKEPEKWKQLYLLQQKLFFLKPIADLTSGPIGKAMISQLNKLSVMKGDPRKVARPVPVLFMPFFLNLIVRMSRELGYPRPWTNFPGVIPFMIQTKKHQEPAVWKGLVLFCKLDIDYFKTDIKPLLTPQECDMISDALGI